MKKILIITIGLVIFSGHAQLIKITDLSKDTMQYFDIKKFEEQADDEGFYSYKDENGNEYSFRKYSECYQQEYIPYNSNITYTTTFHPGNGALRSQLVQLFSMPYGKYKYYDINGKLISAEDYDEGFKTGIEDIRKKVVNEFGLDILLKDSQTNVHRSKNTFSYLKVSDKKYNLYEIIVPMNKTDFPDYYYKIEVDADTGEELGRIRYWNDGSDHGEEYLKQINLYRDEQLKK